MSDIGDMSVLAMFVIGLMGAGHCVGMCGGIVAALGFATEGKGRRWPILLSYNLGRILSYSVAGGLVGLLGLFGREYLFLGPWLRGLSGVLLILMGLYLADWWRVLSWLERGGQYIWRYLQPLGNGLFRVTGAGRGFLFGMLWGWLPCGLVYSALAFAAATAEPLSGALAMAAFGVGTLPAMLAGGFFSTQLKQWLQGRVLRSLMALVLILFGAWIVWSAMAHAHHQPVEAASENGTSNTDHQHMHH